MIYLLSHDNTENDMRSVQQATQIKRETRTQLSNGNWQKLQRKHPTQQTKNVVFVL